jgi:putative membrane protein
MLNMHDFWMGWWWPFGGLFWLALAGLAVFGIVTLLRRDPKDHGHTDDSAAALRILDERYAKNEIVRSDYLQRKRDILGKGEP